MEYAIYEGNMERLKKKMKRIQNKCAKYGCEFRFEEVGEEFREIEDGDEKFTVRYVKIEAEGHAVINNWKFIATIDHTEKGNIISSACDIEVPERYYNSRPVCEHCNRVRSRRDTYIVMNTETGEFKQVGKSCLADFTHGMSAEGVAQYISAFDELIKGEAYCAGNYAPRYYQTEEFLRYAAETIRHFGYVKTDMEGQRSTKDRASAYLKVDNGEIRYYESIRMLRQEMDDCGFDADSAEAVKMAQDALAWVAEQDENSNYIHNLKTVCAMNWITSARFGLLASIFPAYNKDLEKKEEQKKRADQEAGSEYIGKVGDRVDIEVDSFRVVTGWETMYGYTAIYKIVDKAGNVLTWKTSRMIPDGTKMITGTVKEHTEFRGVKQTELTRCKCIA